LGCQNRTPANFHSAEAVPTAPSIDDPVTKRWEQLLDDLRTRNPEFDAEHAGYEPAEGKLAALQLDDTKLQDISPIAGLPLKFLSLKNCPVSDVAVIKGMPLEQLALEETQVSDLSPLSGMPLHSLWLNGAPVSDLKPLEGLPLTSLNLLKTMVTDVTPLRGMPLESLWLNDTGVADISSLDESPLVSLTLHKTLVSDISVVRKLPALQRLHIADTEVTDLRPLAGLRLTRLIFTPAKITQGLDVVRQLDTLQELDVEFREPQRWSPEEFWRHYDAGELR